MKTWVFWLLFLFALSRAQGCFEAKADACLDAILNAVLGDVSKQEACRELEDGIECINAAAVQCGTEVEPEFVEVLSELDRILRENCEVRKSDNAANNDDDDVEHAKINQCLENNEDYIYECMVEGTEKTLEHVMERNIQDENYIKCTMFGNIASCFVRRVRERCGEEAARITEVAFSKEIPVEVRDACEKAAGVDDTVLNLLENKKKK